MKIKISDFFLIPNLLTIFRFLIYPFIFHFLKKESFTLAVILILIAVVTDLLDGFLARGLNQVSDLGKILDPLVDKSGIGIFIVFVTTYKGFPLWACILIITKEFLTLLVSLFIIIKRKIIPVSAFWGKFNAFIWGLTIVFYILELDFIKKISLAIAIFFVLMTAFYYAKQYLKNARRFAVDDSNIGNPSS